MPSSSMKFSGGVWIFKGPCFKNRPGKKRSFCRSGWNQIGEHDESIWKQYRIYVKRKLHWLMLIDCWLMMLFHVFNGSYCHCVSLLVSLSLSHCIPYALHMKARISLVSTDWLSPQSYWGWLANGAKQIESARVQREPVWLPCIFVPTPLSTPVTGYSLQDLVL